MFLKYNFYNLLIVHQVPTHFNHTSSFEAVISGIAIRILLYFHYN